MLQHLIIQAPFRADDDAGRMATQGHGALNGRYGTLDITDSLTRYRHPGGKPPVLRRHFGRSLRTS
ncbi:MAG: hypothetical protein E7K72_25070, partial [Roseomonas mucosa]|nr:hypothetical protein [Roseomonas mucosa]